MRIISEFKDKRYYGLHEGIDITGTKQSTVHVIADGVVEYTGIRGSYGNVVVVRHNAKYFSDPYEDMYSLYAHLSEIRPDMGSMNYIKKGAVVGYMGNTGTCLTGYDANGNLSRVTRKVTPEEQADPNCNFGVHAHISVYQLNSLETELSRYFKKHGILTADDILFQSAFGAVHMYFNPVPIIDFFDKRGEAK